jgi:NAD(P)-dependent dehydrogenase (short-subunit alcohol dehydrogenase family)
MHHVVV